MSLPANNNNKTQGQPSIRSFFAPKSPSYVPAPSTSATASKSSTGSLPPPPPTTTVPPPQPTQLPPTLPPAPQLQQQAATRYTARRPQSLHPQASIVPIEPEHVPALRRITSLILPINYPDSFYAQLSNPATSGAFSRVILWTEPRSTPKVIGGLVCRPEELPFPTPSGGHINGLYIQSLVLLSPYRSLGLAASCLEEVVTAAAANSSSSWNCETVWAHVWTQNDEGLDWYKRRGFGVAGEIKNYYFKLQPGDALVVQRPIVIDRQPTASAGMTYSNSSFTTHIPPSTTAMAANLPLCSLPPTAAHKSAPPPPPSSNGTVRPPPPSTSPNGSSVPPPPRSATSAKRPPPPPTNGTPAGTSFQNLRPETEWNDLPADMQAAAAANGSRSGGSSRSSSAVAASRKKRDRAYPAAAFGAK